MKLYKKIIICALSLFGVFVIGASIFIGVKVVQIANAIASLPTPGPIEYNVNVAPVVMPNAGTEGSWIAPGGFGFAPFNMGSVPAGSYESISYHLGVDGTISHEWVSVRADSNTIAGEGATFKDIYTYNEEETYLAVVAFKSDGSQWVFVLDQDGNVFDSFEVSVATYGTIESLHTLTVAAEEVNVKGDVRVVAKVLCVTETGHWYRHWPSDGSQSPAIDDLLH
jgi:hypothetical protein